jgi:hypothetical protein
MVAAVNQPDLQDDSFIAAASPLYGYHSQSGRSLETQESTQSRGSSPSVTALSVLVLCCAVLKAESFRRSCILQHDCSDGLGFCAQENTACMTVSIWKSVISAAEMLLSLQFCRSP